MEDVQGQKMEAGEQQEDAELDQILQLCQSGSPEALGQIAKIVEGMKSNQQAEESQIEGGEQPTGSHAEMLKAVEAQMGGK